MQINVSTNPTQQTWIDGSFIAVVCDAETSRKIITQNLCDLVYSGRIPVHVYSPESLSDKPYKST